MNGRVYSKQYWAAVITLMLAVVARVSPELGEQLSWFKEELALVVPPLLIVLREVTNGPVGEKTRLLE